MANEFTKKPIPYVSNKMYLWRFLKGFFCGAIFGLGLGSVGFGIGAGLGVGTVFALRPKNKSPVQFGIMALAVGICSGIGRFCEMPIPGAILGFVLGYAAYYYWKYRTEKSKFENLETS